MVTEEKAERFARSPTEEEWAEFLELADRIKRINRRIDHVRNRLAHGVTVTDAERAESLNDRIELDSLLDRAERFMAKYG